MLEPQRSRGRRSFWGYFSAGRGPTENAGHRGQAGAVKCLRSFTSNTVPMPNPELSSLWDDLNPNLLARFTAIDYDGTPLPNEPDVIAPFVEGATMSMQLNWQSPFENMGPESKAPTLSALIQSGALLPLTRTAADQALRTDQGPLQRALSDLVQGAESGIAESRGLTGITKLNSTQIFNGMPPVKISGSLLFRAWLDPVKEVEQPIQQLKEWAVPKRLAPTSFLLGGALSQTGGSFIQRLLPSEAPTLVQLVFGTKRFPPMVIESIEEPLTSPKSGNGDYVECLLPITLATLTAIDRKDLIGLFNRERSLR